MIMKNDTWVELGKELSQHFAPIGLKVVKSKILDKRSVQKKAKVTFSTTF